MTRSVALLGMMGVGKSTVGRALAARLDRAFVDTDDVVVTAAGMSIPEVFAEDGESGFRARERVAIAATVTTPGLVIGLGGGAVLDDRNVEVLQEHATLVLLDVAIGTLVDRLNGSEHGRPLLADGELSMRLSALAAARGSRYREVADVTVDGSGPVEDVVVAIVAALAARGDVPAEVAP